jgi:hypothetical protein
MGMVFAGEVFPEWYWGPILFAVVFGLPLSAAAFAVDFAVRRWVRRLAWPERAGLWAAVLVGGSLAILGGRALIDHVRFERDAKAAVRNLDFAPYGTESLPGGFTEQLVHADDYLGTPVIVSRYDVGPGAYAFAYQQAPREVSLQDGRCDVRRLAGASTNFFDGPCRELRTPRGRTVYLGTLEHLVDGGEAFALLDGTLVRLDYVQVTDRDVLAYFDSLRPIAPDEIDFKEG